MPRLRFAGQITGVEGYVESAAIGLLAGRFAAAERVGSADAPPPPTTALGALLAHITGGHLLAAEGAGSFQPPSFQPPSFQPMNINHGLLPPLDAPERDGEGKRIKGKQKGRAKKHAVALRALADLEAWLSHRKAPAAAE
jgi:methylenetetrahydrofolate--tRNA-(uracil-5-)-methyltransferase